jgi:sulfate adenylyltransferase
MRRVPAPEQSAVAQWTPSARELDDLELLGMGVLAVDGFTAPSPAGPTALTLAVPTEVADRGEVELLDPEGLPLARVAVRETYQLPDADDGLVGVVGPVRPLTAPQFGPFRRFVRAPADLPPAERLAVPVVAPLTQEALADVATTAAERGATPLLVICTGTGTPQGVSAPALVRAGLAAALAIDGAEVVAVPVASRGDRGADTALRETVAAAYGSVHRPRADGTLAPDVAALVEQDRPPRHRRGVVIFLTGLSGSGKSTIARAVHDLLLERGDRTVTSLDGDVVRHHLSKGLGFSRADRETNIARIGWVAAEISRHHGVALCSPIAPFDSTRQQVRAMVDAAGGGFVLIHVATPLEECERRDRKGLYAKARAGVIPEFTGISSPYEIPADADLTVDTTGRDLDECVDEVMVLLRDAGWLAG